MSDASQSLSLETPLENNEQDDILSEVDEQSHKNVTSIGSETETSITSISADSLCTKLKRTNSWHCGDSKVGSKEEEDFVSPGVKFKRIDSLSLSGQSEPVKNTIHSTRFGMRLFQEWCTKNDINIDLDKISEMRLDDILSDFFISVRNRDGERYSENSLMNIKYSINRYLCSLPEDSKKDIRNSTFKKTNEVLNKQITAIRNETKAKSQRRPETMVISREDLTKLYDGETFNTNQPESLLHKVWFEICLHFCHKRREVQRHLSRDLFAFEVDESGRRFVYCKKLLNYKYESAVYESDPKWRRMVEVKGHPMCPVASLEKYLSKIEKMHTFDERCLFFRPRTRQPISRDVPDDKWYSSTAVGKNSLSSFLTTICKKAELSKIYHSVVLKTLPIQRWREIVFETKRCIPNLLPRPIPQLAQPQGNIYPMQPVSMTNILGNIIVSREQYNMLSSPYGSSYPMVSVQGAGDMRPVPLNLTIGNISSLNQIQQHNTTGQPIDLSVCSTSSKNPQLISNSTDIHPGTESMNKSYLGKLIPQLRRPEATLTNAQSRTVDIQQHRSKPSKDIHQLVTKQPVDLNTTRKDQNEEDTELNYAEAKAAVIKIFNRVDYWNLAKLVNWLKRVDVLKDTKGKVFCWDSKEPVQKRSSSVSQTSEPQTPGPEFKTQAQTLSTNQGCFSSNQSSKFKVFSNFVANVPNTKLQVSGPANATVFQNNSAGMSSTRKPTRDPTKFSAADSISPNRLNQCDKSYKKSDVLGQTTPTGKKSPNSPSPQKEKPLCSVETTPNTTDFSYHSQSGSKTHPLRSSKRKRSFPVKLFRNYAVDSHTINSSNKDPVDDNDKSHDKALETTSSPSLSNKNPCLPKHMV